MLDKNTRVLKVVSLLFLIAVCGVLFVFGCGKKDTEDKQKELVILCGSSFASPTERLCAEFTAKTGIAVITTLAGSEDFLPLVKAAQKGDVLVTHDPYLDYVAKAKALAGHVPVGFVAPVLAVQKGNPKGIASVEDLSRPDLKVALSNPEYSTCGEMVFALLKKKGIEEAVMKNVGNRLTKGHATLGTFVKTKAVDVVIMWNGVAATFGNSLDVVPSPYEYDNDIRVHVIGLSYSQYPEEVKMFIEFARANGKEIYSEYGYVK